MRVRTFVACLPVSLHRVLRRCGHQHRTVTGAEFCRRDLGFSQVLALDPANDCHGRLWPLMKEEEEERGRLSDLLPVPGCEACQEFGFRCTDCRQSARRRKLARLADEDDETFEERERWIKNNLGDLCREAAIDHDDHTQDIDERNHR